MTMSKLTKLQKAIANFKVARIGLNMATKNLEEAIGPLPDTVKELEDLLATLPTDFRSSWRIHEKILFLEGGYNEPENKSN